MSNHGCFVSKYLVQQMPEAATGPIVAYKFVRKEHLSLWADKCTLRIGTLNDYADLVTDGGVGDIQERFVSGISHYIDDSESEKNQMLLNNLSFLGLLDVKNCKDFSIIDSSYSNPNAYVFCTSRYLNKEIFRFWKEKEGYDAVIRILDLQKLVHSILHYDSLGERILGQIGAIFLVKYLNLPEDLARVDITNHKFIKDAQLFSWQEEIRLLWDVEPHSSYYDIHLPNMRTLIEVMYLPPDW
ncbi:hypothetical protein [Rheinheimera faecalis]